MTAVLSLLAMMAEVSPMAARVSRPIGSRAALPSTRPHAMILSSDLVMLSSAFMTFALAAKL